MNFLRRLLNRPLKQTITVIIVGGILWMASSAVYLYVDRLTASRCFDSGMVRDCQNEIIGERIAGVVSGDFMLVSRIIVEVAMVVLIIQIGMLLVSKFRATGS